jgi:hypothetical protein
MRLGFLLLAALFAARPSWAQAQSPSSAGGTASSPQAGQESAGSPDLPVSLDRIREGLAKPAPLLLRTDRKPDFRTQVEEEQRLSEIIASLDFRSGPAPPGGLYQYEQQRLSRSPLEHPLMQPYAAFSGGEMITLAIENLIWQLLSGKAADAITDGDRERAEAAARVEVARAIAEYCAAQPRRGSGILVCDNPSVAR